MAGPITVNHFTLLSMLFNSFGVELPQPPPWLLVVRVDIGEALGLGGLILAARSEAGAHQRPLRQTSYSGLSPSVNST